jgi:hypothetical protein
LGRPFVEAGVSLRFQCFAAEDKRVRQEEEREGMDIRLVELETLSDLVHSTCDLLVEDEGDDDVLYLLRRDTQLLWIISRQYT